jgi:hypothetical protein
MSIKLKYFLVMVATFLVASYVCNDHRAYVYENNLDSVFADMGSNLFCVPLVCHLWWLLNFSPAKNKLYDVVLLTSSYVLYEFMTYFFPSVGTFDILDIIGLIVSAFATFIILRLEDQKGFHLAYRDFKSTYLNLATGLINSK